MRSAFFARNLNEGRRDLFIRREQSPFGDNWGGGGQARPAPRVSSETDVLDTVLLGAPSHLSIVPANSVSRESLRKGLCCSSELARAEHRMLEETFARHGIKAHIVPARPDLPDLAFTRDTSLMTPWGLLELRPAAEHRRAEAPYVASVVRDLGFPILGRIEEGHVEGGDISIVRPGLVIIGCSGERTNETGAQAVARIFERQGWRAIVYRFDPHFLHLDTIFCMVDENRALACVDVLDDGFLLQLQAQGIELIPVSYKEARKLGCNVLSLGKKRILSTRENSRVNSVLGALGYTVIEAGIEQFTRCGGGVHCLTMPLARR
jgi:arginine deiminase